MRVQVIRSDSGELRLHPSLYNSRLLTAPIAVSPVMRATRAEAMQRMKARWEEEKRKGSGNGGL
jgi:hypothetical protein